MTTATLLEPIDPVAGATIASRLPSDEEVLMRVTTDLNSEGNFGRQWLAVTGRRVLLVAEPMADKVVEIAVDDLRAVQTEPLVGGGRLEFERLNQPTIYMLFSSSMARKFSEVARGLEQLRKNEPFLVNPQLDTHPLSQVWPPVAGKGRDLPGLCEQVDGH